MNITIVTTKTKKRDMVFKDVSYFHICNLSKLKKIDIASIGKDSVSIPLCNINFIHVHND